MLEKYARDLADAVFLYQERAVKDNFRAVLCCQSTGEGTGLG
jgi:hypothetical protein